MRRCNSAALLECGGRYYLLDAGDGACTGMIRGGYLPSMLTGAFISHMHDDHCGGITSVVKSALKYREQYPENRLALCLPQAGATRVCREWLELFLAPERVAELEIKEYTSGTFYDDGTVKVTAIPTCHLPCGSDGSPRSFGWLIEGEGQKVLFTGDLSPDFSDFPRSEEYCDMVFCELTHFDMKYALPILEKLSCGELVFTHVYDPWDTPAGRETLQKLKLPYPVSVAEDGMTFCIK